MLLMLGLTVGNLTLSNLSIFALGMASVVFLCSFFLVSIKNDNRGMMRWIFEKNNISDEI